MQEMGESGTGSTEQGDASGEIFWMPYVPTFLQYFYETFPRMLPQPKDKAAGTGADVPQTAKWGFNDVPPCALRRRPALLSESSAVCVNYS